MARIQSGGFNLKKEWLTLEEVVGSALQMLEPGLSAPINLSLPEPLTLIHVDGPLFERVLINLLENAVKYAGPQAQIGIDASVDGAHLQLDVWDNGPGIPSGMEQRVFDKFSGEIKSHRCPALGWGWQFVRLLWTCTAVLFRSTIARKEEPVFVLHCPRKFPLNLKIFMRICDERTDC